MLIVIDITCINRSPRADPDPRKQKPFNSRAVHIYTNSRNRYMLTPRQQSTLQRKSTRQRDDKSRTIHSSPIQLDFRVFRPSAPTPLLQPQPPHAHTHQLRRSESQRIRNKRKYRSYRKLIPIPPTLPSQHHNHSQLRHSQWPPHPPQT